MIVVGVVGYIETPRGLRALTTVWAGHLSDEVKRRFYKNWYKSKQKAFTKYAKKYTENNKMEKEIQRAKDYCTVVRAICHTQISKAKVGSKKAQVMEIQINGGTPAEKVDFVTKMFEQPLPVASVFNNNEMIDVLAPTKGKGYSGLITRWGCSRLARKSHRGQRKVACIGSWHPMRVQFQVPRTGQLGYHHRTEINKKIYRVGKSVREDPNNAHADNDLTEKAITPVGGFPHYGLINEDWLMVKGCIPGSRKRAVKLRKSLLPQTKRSALEEITLKFIDTSSKLGHGRFQTNEEKAKFYGTGTRKKAEEAKAKA